jgi:cell division septum initiation protein DivIVA
MSEELMVPGDGRFKVVRRGYDKFEVDGYVERLQRRIEELQEHQTPDDAVRDALARVGDEVSSVLRQAHQSADQMVAEAQREADDHRERAAREAAAVTAIAERRVHALDVDTDRIWAERERIVADARDLASRLQAVADLATERFPSDGASQNGAAERNSLGFSSAEPDFENIDVDA